VCYYKGRGRCLLGNVIKLLLHEIGRQVLRLCLVIVLIMSISNTNV